MKTQMTSNTTRIEYDDDEISFIRTLSDAEKRLVRMGLVTVYDLGYKPNTTRRV